MDFNSPLFPDLYPKLTDPLWFNIDKVVDDDSELTELEREHTQYLASISQKYMDLIPIGKSAAEVPEEEEEEEEEDDNDDDDTDTHDDDEDEDIEMEVSYNQ